MPVTNINFLFSVSLTLTHINNGIRSQARTENECVTSFWRLFLLSKNPIRQFEPVTIKNVVFLMATILFLCKCAFQPEKEKKETLFKS